MIPTALKPPRRSVLIVDRSEECREILRTLLERRGVTTYEASGLGQGLELVRRHHPGVIVLDMETDGEGGPAPGEQYGAVSEASRAPLILLGDARRSPGRRVVRKPYHYAPLIRTIEELLEHSPAGEPSE